MTDQTTFTIPRQLVDEEALHLYMVDASDARIPPGTIYRCIHVPGLGNDQPFRLHRIEKLDDHATRIHYLQTLGCTRLIVWDT